MDGKHKLFFKVLSRVDGSPIFIAVLLLELLLHFGSLLRSPHSEKEMLSDLSCQKVRINGSSGARIWSAGPWLHAAICLSLVKTSEFPLSDGLTQE